MTPITETLDPGIAHIVQALRDAGIDTFSSCEGSGPEHAFPEPTVLFRGDHAAGFTAATIAVRARLPIKQLMEVYDFTDGLIGDPHWRMTFWTLKHAPWWWLSPDSP